MGFTLKLIPGITLLLAVLLHFFGGLHSLSFAHERYHLPLRWVPAVLLGGTYLIFWCREVVWAFD